MSRQLLKTDENVSKIVIGSKTYKKKSKKKCSIGSQREKKKEKKKRRKREKDSFNTYLIE